MPVQWWLVAGQNLVRWAREEDGLVQVLDERDAFKSPVSATPSVAEAMKRLVGPDAEVKKSRLAPGQYHPRIWTPGCSPDPWRYPSNWADSIQGVSALFDEMGQVFRYVEPNEANEDTYGHEIRQLLILACTEFETACKAILTENGYQEHEKTTHYVKLRDPMQLRAWRVSLRWHEGFKEFAPFEDWDEDRATQTIPWYHAYNGTKHDRLTQFPRASLKNMVHAMGALYVLVTAQYGRWQGPEADVAFWRPDGFANKHFRLRARPHWKPFGRAPTVPNQSSLTLTPVPYFG